MDPLEVFKKFSLEEIAEKLRKANAAICEENFRPFPNLSLLSQYQFTEKQINILSGGKPTGGTLEMCSSLFDFSFVRSLTASCYSTKGPPCYDPVSLYCIVVFQYLDRFNTMKSFLGMIRDKERGEIYRVYFGLSDDRIPCEGTMSNFKKRLTDFLFSKIFHQVVEIFRRIEMISFKILPQDGTLYPTWSRYKGCTYFCDQCEKIKVENIIEKCKARILYRLNHMDENNLGSEIRVYDQCQSDKFPDDVEKPNIELFAFRLAFKTAESTAEQKNTAILFQIEKELEKQNLVLVTIRSNLTGLNIWDESLTFKCPKLPKDKDARVGVRRNLKNPSKKEKVFGYNLVLATSVEVELNLELPVAATNIAGAADEAHQYIKNRKQIDQFHPNQVVADILDAKYDAHKNYDYSRNRGSIPFIDYNRRKEDVSKKALIERGYDTNGFPFAPCGLLCRFNGNEEARHRLKFCCFKECLNLRAPALEGLSSRFDISSCEHLKNKTGYGRSMEIEDHPRLLIEIPRGTERFKRVMNFRSASERANSALKGDLNVLVKPRILNKFRADILAQIAATVLILNRGFNFIGKVTSLFTQYVKAPNKKEKEGIVKKLIPNPAPKFILNMVSRK